MKGKFTNKRLKVKCQVDNNVCKASMGFPGGICLLLQEMQETQVRSLGQEDPLEKDMATHSSILAWKIPRTQEPGGLQSMGSQRVGNDLLTEHTAQKHPWMFLVNVFIPSDFHLTGDTANAAALPQGCTLWCLEAAARAAVEPTGNPYEGLPWVPPLNSVV